MCAAHQILDAPPRILDDPIIETLLGRKAIDRISNASGEYQTPERLALRAHVVLRSRYCEDRLRAAVERGATQYVILGAGLDTFAYRQPPWAGGLKICEVDHPSTQDVKKGLLKLAGLWLPGNVALVAVDFEGETLREGLMRHGVLFDEPTLFSWLGVTMYLSQAAIDSVLHTIAGFPSGSEVVLTFARSDLPRSPFDRRSAELGEHWISYFTPDSIEARIRAHGFSTVELLEPEQAESTYFRGSASHLPVPRHTSIVSARL